MPNGETPKLNLRDTAERLLWTFIAAAGGNALGASLLGIDQIKAAALAGLIAVIQLVTLIARARLAVLPSPGEGLPGFPTEVGP